MSDYSARLALKRATLKLIMALEEECDTTMEAFQWLYCAFWEYQQDFGEGNDLVFNFRLKCDAYDYGENFKTQLYNALKGFDETHTNRDIEIKVNELLDVTDMEQELTGFIGDVAGCAFVSFFG